MKMINIWCPILKIPQTQTVNCVKILTQLTIYSNVIYEGAVVQLVRAPLCQGGSCGFESRQPRSIIKNRFLC